MTHCGRVRVGDHVPIMRQTLTALMFSSTAFTVFGSHTGGLIVLSNAPAPYSILHYCPPVMPPYTRYINARSFGEVGHQKGGYCHKTL